MAKYEVIHDKVRIAAGDARQWIVYIDGKLRTQATSEQSAKDFVAIERDKAKRAKGGDRVMAILGAIVVGFLVMSILCLCLVEV